MVNPKPISEMEVRTHAMSVRSAASRVRSQAKCVDASALTSKRCTGCSGFGNGIIGRSRGAGSTSPRAAAGAPSPSAPGAARRVAHLGHRLVDGEAGGLLARRKLLEALQEVRHDRLRSEDDVVVVEEPVV